MHRTVSTSLRCEHLSHLPTNKGGGTVFCIKSEDGESWKPYFFIRVCHTKGPEKGRGYSTGTHIERYTAHIHKAENVMCPIAGDERYAEKERRRLESVAAEIVHDTRQKPRDNVHVGEYVLPVYVYKRVSEGCVHLLAGDMDHLLPDWQG